MKQFRALFVSLLIIAAGMPQPARAQAAAQPAPESLELPEARSGEAYRASIDATLRDRYGLRLETTSRAPLFRWTFAGGELPPGLLLRVGGTLVGTPRAPRAEPYRFQLKVLDASVSGAGALTLNFTLKVEAASIRLVRVNAPRLVPADAPAGERMSHVRADAGGNGTAAPTPLAPRAAEPAEPSVDNSSRAATRRASGVSSASFLRASANAAGAGAIDATTATALQAANCDPATAPGPTATPGYGVFYLDARNGTITEGGRLVTSRRRFAKDERAVVVIDNKNPYLYTYRYTSAATSVTDTAPGVFVPFITGSLGELGAGEPEPDVAATPVPATPQPTPTPAGTPSKGKPTPTPDPCKEAKDKTAALRLDINAANVKAREIRELLSAQREHSARLTGEYNRARAPLYSQNQTRGSLYCASTNLVQVVGSNIDRTKVDPKTLEELDERIENLKRTAGRFEGRIEGIKEAHASCLGVIGEDLRRADEAAEDLVAGVEKFREVLEKINADLATAVAGRDAAQSVLNDPRAFFDERVEGGFEETKKVDIKLEVTPRPNVPQAQPVQGSPFMAEFTFGGAPFFSISGGLIFSPLRKREYVRVQGFERDREGELVLTDGKPNLTTVVGVDERSPTRITPAIFLNGRLTDRLNGFVDGVHLTLGITAKNDNKGTDVEFLIGPSASFFDGQMFLTGGGYAGRQQKLGGGLFEGFAVPAEVDELPIEKSYRWNFGFSLSYRIPVNK